MVPVVLNAETHSQMPVANCEKDAEGKGMF